MKNIIEVDGVKYQRIEPNGKRAVVVIDRGWIFAGDVEEANGRIKLSRAVWVFNWPSIGFAAVVANPKQKGVDIRPMPTPVDVPTDAEIFRLPVEDNWGL